MKKSSDKHQQIIDVAKKIFIKKGFDATSMAEISAKVGGSKATLYNHFSSKDELFGAVMFEASEKMASPLFDKLENQDEPLKDLLMDFGTSFLHFMLSSAMINIRRIVIADLYKIKGGTEIFKNGPVKKWQKIADIIEFHMNKGTLKKKDPWRAAMQLISLLEQEHITLSLLNQKHKISDKEMEDTVVEAIEMFWGYYADE